MATGGNYDSEDSGYRSVRGYRNREIETDTNMTSRDITELNSIKAMNEILNKKVKNLKQEINEQKLEFNQEKMSLIRNHKRENDYLKKRREKNLDFISDKTRENKVQADKIKQLKSIIDSLEVNEKDLKEKLEKARRKDGKHMNEYDQQTRELLSSKEEIKRLKEQIVILENEKAEIADEATKESKHIADLSADIGNMNRKHEQDIAALKNDLKKDFHEEMDNVYQKIETLFHRGQCQTQGTDSGPTPTFDHNKRQPLPSIARSLSPSSHTTPGTDSKPPWKPTF